MSTRWFPSSVLEKDRDGNERPAIVPTGNCHALPSRFARSVCSRALRDGFAVPAVAALRAALCPFAWYAGPKVPDYSLIHSQSKL
ncbi:hypothetical protein JMJ58_09100 [Haloterrigena salifodinae]|uniref:Uncharacterized protein n=1 Tax=Haloterrigena salifodinae TaxID=2675099 RepID=A0A8T8E6C1_9EURY|nr:hypothetical protein [Haloterrigena salifodinae]QRV17002.1 hypothetical protein JMJ58_09100 [Haloterrigena salifodinae]